MRRIHRRTLALLSLCALLAAAPAALAQAQYGDPLGALRLSFDDVSQVDQLDVQAGEEFEFYVSSEISFGDPTRDAVDGLNAWEASVELPQQVNVLERELYQISQTCTGGSCGDDWFVILNECVRANLGRTVLVRYRAQLLNDVSDQIIRLQPASLSSFDDLAPGWAACIRGTDPAQYLHPFASGWNNELILNSSVTTQSKSWAATKALYN